MDGVLVTADLTWNANVDDAVGYVLYHGTQAGVVDDSLLIPGAGTVAYTYTGLPDGIPHYFTIAAYDALMNITAQSVAVSKSGPAPSLRRMIVMGGMAR